MINSTITNDTVLTSQLIVISRIDIRNNYELRKELSEIIQEEEKTSDYPLPVPNISYYELMFSIDPFPYSKTTYVLYKLGNDLIAFGNISSNSKISPRLASIFIYVKTDHRKNRIAKEILSELIKNIPIRIEKIVFSIRSDKTAPNYEERVKLLQYVKNLAGKSTFKARRSISDLTQFKLENISSIAKQLKEKSFMKGFSILFFENKPNFQNFPFSKIEYMKFMESIDNDMPREESSWDDLELDDEIFFHNFNNLEKLNRTKWTFVAIHEKSNRPAGMTEVTILNDMPQVIFQGDTGVHKDFRGKRLGKTLKYLMLERILSHKLTKESKYWSTFNAGSNNYMISINNELGYIENGIWNQFEMEKELFIELFKDKY